MKTLSTIIFVITSLCFSASASAGVTAITLEGMRVAKVGVEVGTQTGHILLVKSQCPSGPCTPHCPSHPCESKAEREVQGFEFGTQSEVSRDGRFAALNFDLTSPSDNSTFQLLSGCQCGSRVKLIVGENGDIGSISLSKGSCGGGVCPSPLHPTAQAARNGNLSGGEHGPTPFNR